MIKKKKKQTFDSCAKAQEVRETLNDHMGQIQDLRLSTPISSSSRPSRCVVSPLLDCCFKVRLRSAVFL